MDDRPRLAPVRPHWRAVGLVPARLDRGQHDVAHEASIVADRDQIPVGQRRQQPGGHALGDPHDDQAALPIQRIMRDRILPFGFAVLTRQVFAGEKRDHPRAAAERRVHPLHEVAVGEVPLLQDDALAAVLQNAPDFAGERRVRARPADEEIDRRSSSPLHSAAPPFTPRSV